MIPRDDEADRNDNMDEGGADKSREGNINAEKVVCMFWLGDYI